MFSFNRFLSLFVVCCSLQFCPVLLLGQNCKLTIEGYVLDESTDVALPYSNIFIEETKQEAIADEKGYFKLTNVCPGNYHIRFSHIGCETNKSYYTIVADTVLSISLSHHSKLLKDVVVKAKTEDNSTEIKNTITEAELIKEGSKNLADILENIQGVSVLRSGASISKPIIHGLYGNRISILNNGITQSGQQWGDDHAPEIDPFAVNELSVIKGTSALAYSGNSLGGVVLAEPKKISIDPHLHGSAHYIFQSNGLGHTLNTQLERHLTWIAWKIIGTLKFVGDRKTPAYYLANTGNKERNVALQLEKRFSEKLKTNLYYSLFNAEIGLLRGSHIENLTDLEEAIGRAVPFFTKDSFSRNIDAPKQNVQHQLLKLDMKYFFSQNHFVHLKYGGQINDRKEFDIRRGGRSGIPALHLYQASHFVEGVYSALFPNKVKLKAGIQYNYLNNRNNPETGILPLIPDYLSNTRSAFVILHKEQDRFFYELGGRYDFKRAHVAAITRTLPREIERNTHSFHNYGLASGIKYIFSQSLKTSLNIGHTMRAPEINELYSNGLHQGTSGIEIGNKELQSERSLKITLTTDWTIKKKLFVQYLFYYQNIQNYIYLQPQSEFQLTIRGAFPVFNYEQTNAVIYGADLFLSYAPKENWEVILKYAHIKGNDTSRNIPLIDIPANNFFGSITYSLKDSKRFSNNSISVTGRYVLEQKNLIFNEDTTVIVPLTTSSPQSMNQDFLAPPADYFLLGIQASTNIQFKKSNLIISLNVENALNETYRDYLNRLRYFADEIGLNASLGLKYSF